MVVEFLGIIRTILSDRWGLRGKQVFKFSFNGFSGYSGGRI